MGFLCARYISHWNPRTPQQGWNDEFDSLMLCCTMQSCGCQPVWSALILSSTCDTYFQINMRGVAW